MRERISIGSYFAASVRNAAFPIREKSGSIALVVVDFATNEIKKLAIKGSDLVSPYLTKDGNRLLFARHLSDRPGRELISCELSQLYCNLIFKSEGSISFPIEISNGRILFVSSPYVVQDGRGRFNWKDIWLYGPVEGIRKLTDLRLYALDALTASRDAIYFSGVGPPPGSSIIPPYDPSMYPRSDIYKLPFDHIQGAIGQFETPLKQLFADQGLSRSPYVSDDESTIAFLRTTTVVGNYRFGLAVARNGRPICLSPSYGLGFSHPVVVGESVYANNIHPDRFWIEILEPGTCLTKRLAEVIDKQIKSQDAIEITLNNTPYNF